MSHAPHNTESRLLAIAQTAVFVAVCIAAIGLVALAALAFNHAASLVQPTSPTWITAYAVIKLGVELASWLIVLSISVFLLLVMVGGCDILLRTQTEREKKAIEYAVDPELGWLKIVAYAYTNLHDRLARKNAS